MSAARQSLPLTLQASREMNLLGSLSRSPMIDAPGFPGFASPSRKLPAGSQVASQYAGAQQIFLLRFALVRACAAPHARASPRAGGDMAGTVRGSQPPPLNSGTLFA